MESKTFAAAKTALLEVVTKHGRDVAIDLLDLFDVEKLTRLDHGRHVEFIECATNVLHSSLPKTLIQGYRNSQARGVPGEPEKKEPTKSIGALIREQQAAKADPCAANVSCAKRDSDENHRPALTWDTKTRFDAFKGWEPVRSWVDFDELSNADHAYSDPLQKLGDTSNPLHGSFALVKKD